MGGVGTESGSRRVGESQGGSTLDRAERERLIALYEDGPRLVREAVAAVPDDAWDRRPAPGEWTPREIVHHLADGEIAAADRLRRLLAEEQPVVLGYDKRAWVERLWPDRPVATAVATFTALRTATAEILRRMSDEDWARVGTHDGFGPFTPEVWLEWYSGHAVDHVDQIARARG